MPMDVATLVIVVGTGAASVFGSFPQWDMAQCHEAQEQMIRDEAKTVKAERNRYFCVPGWPQGAHDALSPEDRDKFAARRKREPK